MIVFLLGATLALAGGFWDDAWHTERGRDSFFIAPHLAIYGGVSAAGAALGAWTLLTLRRGAWAALRAQPGLVLGLLSIALTLGSAPIDNVWHDTFGRDAVIWSPPHMLGIVGAMGLAYAVLVTLRDSGALLTDVRCVLASGLVLAAASFVVVEYETDVPQFPVRWYLPALVAASTLAFALVRRASPGQWTTTIAAGAQLLFVAAVAGLLMLLGFQPPLLPLLLVPAVCFDLFARSKLSARTRALLHTATVFAVYAPVRAWQDPGLHMGAADLGSGLVVGVVVAMAILGAVEGQRPSLAPATAGLLGCIVALTIGLHSPARALAHDPGQGADADAGTVALTVRNEDRLLRVSGAFAPPCPGLRAGSVIARRGGQSRGAPLAQRGCTLSGSLSVPTSGRWFVYISAEKGATPLESWLPITVTNGEHTVQDTARFAYTPSPTDGNALKTVIGALLYAIASALLAAMVCLSTRSRTQPML